MTMTGRIAIAPCGHTGETIIGNYVKCFTCDVPGAKPHRGEIGHVPTCACVGCKVRRSATRIQLRTRDGKTYVEIPWDGINNEPKAETKGFGVLTNYRFVSESGEVIAQGTVKEIMVDGGYEITMPIPEFIKALSTMEAVKLPVKDKVKVVRYFAPMTLPAAPALAPSSLLIKQDLESGAVAGIKEVDVKVGQGLIDVYIRQFSIPFTTNWSVEQSKIRQDVSSWLRKTYSNQNTYAGDYSPIRLLTQSAKILEMDYKSGHVPPAGFHAWMITDLVDQELGDQAKVTAALTYTNMTGLKKHTFILHWYGINWVAEFDH